MEIEKQGDNKEVSKNISTDGNLNIGEMSTEEITEAVESGSLSVDDVKLYSEELEAQHKTSHIDEKSQQILTDRIGKIDNLRSKSQPAPITNEVKEVVEIEDLITLRENKFSKDSDEAKVLEQFKNAGLITDYASGLEDVAIKAKIGAIKATKIAAHQVDMSDDEILKTSRKEMQNEFETGGNVPESVDDQRKLAADNLEKMGL